MALIGTFSDTFNDNVIGPNWGNSYGGVSEIGGRARCPASAGNYAGYQTAKDWTLAGSSASIQLPLAAAANGATTDALSVFNIIQATPGTNIAIAVNTVANTIRFENNVNYFDGSAVSLTYSAATHAWLRIRESGGTLFWDTSTDGSAWTNRRSIATPSWVTSSIDAIAVEFFAYRNNGTTNYSEFDNFNITGGGSVYTASATLTADSSLTAAASSSAIVSAALTAETSLDAATTLSATAEAALTADSTLTAQTDAAARDDLTTYLSAPHSGWVVSRPWI